MIKCSQAQALTGAIVVGDLFKIFKTFGMFGFDVRYIPTSFYSTGFNQSVVNGVSGEVCDFV